MVLFLDGCSHYSTSELAFKYNAVNSTACTFAIEAAGGRTDDCILRTATAQSTTTGFLTITPLYTQSGTWTQQASGIFGCALKVDDIADLNGPAQPNNGDITGTFLSIYSGLTCVLAVAINNDGTFTVYRQRLIVYGGSVVLGTTSGGISSGVYSYVQVKWTLSQTAGFIEIVVDGNTLLTYNGRTMPNTADVFPFAVPASTWSSVNVLGMDSAVAPNLMIARMCDVYLADTNAPNNDYLGDISIAYIKPNGVGAVAGWTPSAGSNYQCVDEVPPNGDTDYVETTAVSTRDSYAFEDVPGSPVAIQVVMWARKTGAGAASLSVGTRQSATYYDGPAQGLSGTSYQFLKQPYDTNPNTSLQWTQTEMNGGEWGPLKAV